MSAKSKFTKISAKEKIWCMYSVKETELLLLVDMRMWGGGENYVGGGGGFVRENKMVVRVAEE